MKALPALLTLIGISLLAQSHALALPFHFKATALFPVQIEEPDPKVLGGTIVKKVNLGTKQIINLAQGLPLDTKVPSNIVLAVNYDDNNANPNHARLVVYDKHLLFEIVTVITLIDPPTSNIKSQDGSKGTGNGLSRATLQATGNLQNGFKTSDICGAATGSKTPGPHGPTTKLSMTSIVGPMQANIDGVLLDGILIKGMFTAGGPPLDPF